MIEAAHEAIGDAIRAELESTIDSGTASRVAAALVKIERQLIALGFMHPGHEGRFNVQINTEHRTLEVTYSEPETHLTPLN